jgi:hypothetical protein
MGYFTYRILKNVPLDRLKRKVEENLALYELGTVGGRISIELAQGDGCSALLLGFSNHEEAVFMPIGMQFGVIWMDVRYQNHVSWDLTIYEGTEHKVGHSVNPWAFEERVNYNQDQIDYRINTVCELWPDHADRIRRYLLPWREPVNKGGRRRFVKRKGKAYDRDDYGYGDAKQIYEFVQAFGIGEDSPIVSIGVSTADLTLPTLND